MTEDHEMRAVTAFLHEAGQLKRARRAGWWIAGVRDPESVAEHSYRTGIIGYVLALMEGANAERTATLCLFHDLLEARVGDVPSTGKRFVTMASPEEVTKEQTAALPEAIGGPIRGLVREFEERTTPEGMCAKDADKLECLLQAREYQAQGYQDVQPWIDTMVAAVRTESGKRLAAAAQTVPPRQWWFEIVSSYGMGSPVPTEAGE